MKRVTPGDIGAAWVSFMCDGGADAWMSGAIHDLMVSCFLAEADLKITGMRRALNRLRVGVMP